MSSAATAVNFASLGKRKNNAGKLTPKKDVPVNVAMRLDKIETFPDAPSMFVGVDAITNEPVRVRMMTVEEGVAVNAKAGADLEGVRAKLHTQYVGNGEAHRPRASEVNDPKHKTHCQTGGLLMFTRALKNEDGSFRAHWVETLEKAPGSGCEQSMVHVSVENIMDKDDRKKVIGTNVVADVAYTEYAVMLTKENALGTLSAGLANLDGDVKRRPFVNLRLIDSATGEVVLYSVRASAKYLESTNMDHDSGVKYTNYDADVPENSIKRLLSAEAGKGDAALIVRGAVWAVTGQDGYPDLSDVTNEDSISDVKQIVDAIRSGVINVEAIPGERISAGPATRASIIKQSAANPNHPINWYTKRNPNGFPLERRYADTFLTTSVGKDGNRYFTKAVMVDCYPKPLPLEKLATINDLQGLRAEAQARVAEKSAGVDEAVQPFNPGALDAVPAESIDEKLAASASAMDMEM